MVKLVVFKHYQLVRNEKLFILTAMVIKELKIKELINQKNQFIQNIFND